MFAFFCLACLFVGAVIVCAIPLFFWFMIGAMKAKAQHNLMISAIKTANREIQQENLRQGYQYDYYRGYYLPDNRR